MELYGERVWLSGERMGLYGTTSISAGQSRVSHGKEGGGTLLQKWNEESINVFTNKAACTPYCMNFRAHFIFQLICIAQGKPWSEKTSTVNNTSTSNNNYSSSSSNNYSNSNGNSYNMNKSRSTPAFSAGGKDYCSGLFPA